MLSYGDQKHRQEGHHTKTVLFSDGEKNSFANLDNYFPNLVTART